MESHKLVDKLKNQTNISYEEAKSALEKTNWDILDAILYLEEAGKIQKPSVSIFYTNEYRENYKYNEVTNNKDQGNNYDNAKKGNTFEGVFVEICKIIDTGNNIFFEMKTKNKVFLRIPITVIILLLIFAFWVVIPLVIVGLFFGVEFTISGNTVEANKLNNVFKRLSVNIKRVKENLKKGFRNG
jgi:hypothetical protein